MIVFLIAIAIDLLLGEYPSKLHPVVYMGRLGKIFDQVRSKLGRGRRSFIEFMLGFSALVGESLLWITVATLVESVKSKVLMIILSALIFKSTFSIRGLYEHVAKCLTSDIEQLRKNVSMIVSRDTSKLDHQHLYSAAIESLSENIHDSYVGPMFYYLLFGLPGAVVYRVVNTYDALFGYRNEKYEWFGKFPARLDDVLNFVPARISTLFIMLFNPSRALSYIKKYGHLKINATYPMSAFAGVLGIGLEKLGYYKFEGPLPTVEDLKRALSLFCKVTVLILAAFTLLLLAVIS
ncbi:cobalamin biosynthesis protein [Fervidobacterium thailandense]|uniref:Cobalamin biosynthesis protein CobD n=1 Tax=Fervidobacterium thailandense TaxID=1008305 RepID=A0A1E3G2V7_9BACT|nr:adenosylcobinamide-phosphate synthase CbiB [Fervidobacterium thailandense]ODN30616.1 cobalamin biosynthesis protein [Fervidobacterium thailandense]